MKSAIETMIGIVVLTFMAVLGTSYITASLSTQRAQNYHTAVVQELENSNFAQSVIDSEKAKATANGYDGVVIDVFTNSENNTTYAKVTLPYKYGIPILGQSRNHEIVGYAR